VIDPFGGADRDRTDDLLSAIFVLVSGHIGLPPADAGFLKTTPTADKSFHLETLFFSRD